MSIIPSKLIITPGRLSGTVDAIPSKSHVHRLLICAALCDRTVSIPCPVLSEDIEATMRCLVSLGADINYSDGMISVVPILQRSNRPAPAAADCGESGSTYRFLAPVAPALGLPTIFKLSGRLPSRPMDALWNALEDKGATINGKGSSAVEVGGKLKPGRFSIPGDVSSQFISGLLFALPMLEGDSEIIISGRLQSAGYVKMTLDALRCFSITVDETQNGFIIPGSQRYKAPCGTVIPEGDWSNSALWLCAAAAGRSTITVRGLRHDSTQGDSAVCEILRRFGANVGIDGDKITVSPGSALHGIEIDAGDIPDLVPALSLVASAAQGRTVITNIERLTLKESDRRDTVCKTINALGGSASYSGGTMTISGCGRLSGGRADSFGDHRLAMLAAAASVISERDIILASADAVKKSYPKFFDDFASLGGKYSSECVLPKNILQEEGL